ncbi:MAG: hypothetical protein AAF492_19870, partial [Verrucomicrobiota bacterium]
PYALIAGQVASNGYLDSPLENGDRFWYRVSAVDTDANASVVSPAVEASPTAPAASIYRASLRAHWDFNTYQTQPHPGPLGLPSGFAGAEGYFPDISGGDHRAYGSNHINTNPPMDTVEGKFHGAFYSETPAGSSDGSSAVVPHHDDINFNQEDFTYVLWEKVLYRDDDNDFSGGGTRGMLFIKAPLVTTPGVTEGLGMNFLRNRFFLVGNDNDGFGQEDFVGTFHSSWDSNRWAHVALVGDYQPATDSYDLTTYIDGQHLAGLDVTITNSIIDNDGFLTIGSFWRGTGYSAQRFHSWNAQSPTGTVGKGWIDDMGVFERAVDEPAIRTMVALGNFAPLAYELDTVVSLLDVHTQESGSVTEGTLTWRYAGNLVGSVGDIAGDPTNGYTIVVNDIAGTGLRGVPALSPPENLSATSGEFIVWLDWDDSANPALMGYNLYRSLSPSGPFLELVTDLVTSDYTDTNVINGTDYYYVATMVTTSGLESGSSGMAIGMPRDATAPAIPLDLAATAIDRSVSLNWQNNTEPDLS